MNGSDRITKSSNSIREKLICGLIIFFHVVYGVLIFKALSHAFSIFRLAWQHYIYKDILVITKSALKQTKRNSFLIAVEDLTKIWSVAGKHISTISVLGKLD